MAKAQLAGKLFKPSKKHHRSVRHVHPSKISTSAKNFISKKIRKLRHEGVRENQAVAISFSIARKRGFKIPPKSKSH